MNEEESRVTALGPGWLEYWLGKDTERSQYQAKRIDFVMKAMRRLGDL